MVPIYIAPGETGDYRPLQKEAAAHAGPAAYCRYCYTVMTMINRRLESDDATNFNDTP